MNNDFIFDLDPTNKGFYALYNVDMFVPTYRKEEDYEDEYSVNDLHKWMHYINMMNKFGKKIYCLVHHEGSNEKPLYAGYILNMRVPKIEFPRRNDKTDLYKMKEIPALLGDIFGMPKYIKDWIMEEKDGGLPGRSMSFRPKKDKKDQSSFDEVSHLALLSPTETPFIKFRDLNKENITDLTVEQQEEISQPMELANFAETNTISYERRGLQQHKETCIRKDYREPKPDEIKTEKEHKGLYLKLKKIFESGGKEFPFTLDEFAEEVSQVHIDENDKYYPNLKTVEKDNMQIPDKVESSVMKKQKVFSDKECEDEVSDDEIKEYCSKLKENPDLQKQFSMEG